MFEGCKVGRRKQGEVEMMNAPRSPLRNPSSLGAPSVCRVCVLVFSCLTLPNHNFLKFLPRSDGTGSPPPPHPSQLNDVSQRKGG